MRISNVEAKEKAIAIARDFLSKQDNRGWQWSCSDASPDKSFGPFKDGKAHQQWAVLVEWSKSGSQYDGPAVLLVNIESGTCVFQ